MLRPLVGAWFRISFTLLVEVTFHLSSRYSVHYRSRTGRDFSLGLWDGPRRFGNKGFLGPRKTSPGYRYCNSCFAQGTFTRCGPAFQHGHARNTCTTTRSYNPRMRCHNRGLAYFPGARHYWGNHCLTFTW